MTRTDGLHAGPRAVDYVNKVNTVEKGKTG